MQPVGKKKYPVTSIGLPAAALGGFLREVMVVLKEKDDLLFRKEGYRRYFIVTAIDPVAFTLKQPNHKTLGRIWTRDFTRMYTSLPSQRVIQEVAQAITEAVDWKAQQLKVLEQEIKFDLHWRWDKKTSCEIGTKGKYLIRDVLELLKEVITGTLFQQNGRSPIRWQTQGLPMGGRSSAEIANLYCYSVESRALDKIKSIYGLAACKMYAQIWRFIDDMLGFGEVNWALFDYGMEHRETTETPNLVVLLGMKIDQNAEGLSLSVQPRGVRPQKFLPWMTTHTLSSRKLVC